MTHIDRAFAYIVDVELKPEHARAVLAKFVDPTKYPQPGGFVNTLLEAAIRADATNLYRLSLGFPGYIAAVYLYKFVDGGVLTLRKLAEAREPAEAGQR